MVRYSITITRTTGTSDTVTITVKKNDVEIGTRSVINFEEGANITLNIDDDGSQINVEIVSTGGGVVGAASTLTIPAKTSSISWNHAQNSSNVTVTPITKPIGTWWMTIDDANNITVHLASQDLFAAHQFRALVI